MKTQSKQYEKITQLVERCRGIVKDVPNIEVIRFSNFSFGDLKFGGEMVDVQMDSEWYAKRPRAKDYRTKEYFQIAFENYKTSFQLKSIDLMQSVSQRLNVASIKHKSYSDNGWAKIRISMENIK